MTLIQAKTFLTCRKIMTQKQNVGECIILKTTVLWKTLLIKQNKFYGGRKHLKNTLKSKNCIHNNNQLHYSLIRLTAYFF